MGQKGKEQTRNKEGCQEDRLNRFFSSSLVKA
jgi:hypothetical protein